MMELWLPDLGTAQGDAYLLLANAIEHAIRIGRLRAGERLLTHRSMARRLGIAVSTVTRGYSEAANRGLLESTVGRGTFVRSDVASPARSDEDTRPLERMYLSIVRGGDIIDLSLNHPLRTGTGKVLSRNLASMAAEADLEELSLYHPPHGRPEHRMAGARWLEFLGLDVDPEDVMVVAGGQTALLSVLLAFGRRGDIVLTESLTWPGALAVAQTLGIRLEPVKIDAEGLDPREFEMACRRFAPRLVYTMPTLHNPTTATAGIERRRAIARIAREHDVMIVEDDAYGFLVEPRAPSYWQIARDITIYLTSLSKPLAPAMRLGYLAARAPFRRRLLATLRATTVMASPLLSGLAARMIENGEAMRCAGVQAAAAQRRQRLADKILGPASSVPASLHRWLPLPASVRSQSFHGGALAQGVAVTPGDVFAATLGDDPRGVRICLCAEPDESRLERALEVLAQLLSVDRSTALPVV